MASSPRGQHELDFEAEEAAILAAVGESRLICWSRTPATRSSWLTGWPALGGMPVVHLSCHGLNNWPARPGDPGVPVLMMEDELGAGRPTTAGDLAGLLTGGAAAAVRVGVPDRDRRGCSRSPAARGRPQGRTRPVAAGGLVAHSLATALVAAGFPAVIGWDGSVDDRAATAFAERLYRALADRADLAVAVGDARRVLLESEDPVVRADWHLARLWLGPAGGGPLVAGSRKRSLVTGDPRHEDVPGPQAAGAGGGGGDVRGPPPGTAAGAAGAALGGPGRGAAARAGPAGQVQPGRPDRRPLPGATRWRWCSATTGRWPSWTRSRTAVRANPAARQLIESRLPEVRQRPEAIEAVLVDLLAGPCAQAGDGGQRPLLLVIDDLEQILVADPAGPHRVAPEHAPVLAGVLRAFDPAETDSRLLLTSRFTFTLDGLQDRLEAVQLRPLSAVAQRKLQRRQQALTPPERQAERAGLAGRALAVSRGNPGLQDLIGLRLVYGEQVSAGPGRGRGGRHGSLPGAGRPARRCRGAGVPGEPGPGHPAGRGRAGRTWRCCGR